MARIMNMNFSVFAHMIPFSPGTGSAKLIPNVQECLQTWLERLSPEVIAQVQPKVVDAEFLEIELSASTRQYLLMLTRFSLKRFGPYA